MAEDKDPLVDDVDEDEDEDEEAYVGAVEEELPEVELSGSGHASGGPTYIRGPGGKLIVSSD